MRFGLDLGGTKIEAIVLDDAGESIWRTRCPTPVADYQAILRTISDLVAQAEQRVGRAVSVGVGMPGSLSPVTRLVRNSNTLCLNGQAIQSDLESLLDRPFGSRMTQIASPSLRLQTARGKALNAFLELF